MSLATDKFFIEALFASHAVKTAFEGRIFDTARPEIDEEEDKIPYLIVTNEGVQNVTESKDDVGESDTDNVTISVLVVATDRQHLAELSQLIRTTLRNAITEDDNEIIDYSFSAGAIQYDGMKPCHFVTLNYQCETENL